MGRKKHIISEICAECEELAERVRQGDSLSEIAVFLEKKHGLSISLPTIKSYIYEHFDRERLQQWHDAIGIILERESDHPSPCLVVRDSLRAVGVAVALPSIRTYISEEFGNDECPIDE